MKKVFITGASGFIGGTLTQELVKAGYSVTCLVRKSSNISRIKDIATLVEAKLDRPKTYKEHLAQADLIIHLAGAVKAINQKDYFRINTKVTRDIVETVRQVNPGLERFVFFSSQAAAGPSTNPKTEDSPDNPVTDYGRSKLAAEKYLRQSGLPYTILRPSAVYGPFDKEFVPVFKSVKSGLTVRMAKDHKLNFVHGDDVTQATIAVLNSTKTLGKTYAVAHPDVHSQDELTDLVAELLQPKRLIRLTLPIWLLKLVGAIADYIGKIRRSPTVFSKDKVNEINNSWMVDPGALMADTGFKYKYNLRKGLTNTLDWYKNQRII